MSVHDAFAIAIPISVRSYRICAYSTADYHYHNTSASTESQISKEALPIHLYIQF